MNGLTRNLAEFVSSLQAGEPVLRALGHAHNPLGMDELRTKFMDCVGDALPLISRDALFEQLSRLEALPAVADLYLGRP